MKRILLVAVAGVVGISGVVRAQSSNCPPGTTLLGIPDRARATQDACQITVDLFQFLAPQLGLSIAGGNATPGQGGNLGMGKIALGVRGNFVKGIIPDVASVTPRTTGASPAQTIKTNSTLLPMATADVALGVFSGIPLGVTNVGGVDAIVSATYVPTIALDAVQVTPQTHLKLGFGGRVGLIKESLVTPGLAVTYLKRDLPVTDIVGSANGSTLSIHNADVQTSAWRITASKSLLLFSLAAGYGQDSYDQSARVDATISGQTSDPIDLAQKIKRSNMFVDVRINLLMLKIVGEIGQAGKISGDPITTFNSFSGGKADDKRTYGSLALRIGF